MMMRMMMRYFWCVLVCFFSISSFSAVNDSAIKVKWGYKGNIVPERWAQLDPHFALCATGKFQTPINITKKVKIADNALSVHFQPAPLMLMDDGSTSVDINNELYLINTGHSVQVDFKSDEKAEYIYFKNEKFKLVQFHFHSPSENTWHGQSYPLEIHFVQQGEHGHLVAMGVFVKAGKPNPAIQEIMTHVPQPDGQDHIIEGVTLNPADLMPADNDYFSFKGSLTTPPCVEDVQWIVMADSITASPAQIALLRKAAGGANARPVQPSNRRAVMYSPEMK